MALVWNEIKPMDGLRVRLKSTLSPTQLKTLTHLYQPLMGSLSYALYLTLSNEVEGERLFSVEKNHQWIMNLMNASLDTIYQARLRLEALGLLKAYIVQKKENQTVFEYELFQPFSAEQFFADDLLSICLYNQVGAQRYKDLRARYAAFYHTLEEERKEKKDITKEFHQVFSSLSPSELVALQGSEMSEQLNLLEEKYPLPKTDESSLANPSFDQYAIDLDALQSMLMKGLDTELVINAQTIPPLKKIAYLYQLDEWSLSRIVQDSLTLKDELDLDLLREKAKEWYRLQEGGQPPKIIHLVQPPAKRVYQGATQTEELSEEEQHLQQLEQMSPLQLLEQFQRGGKVSDADVKLAEELLLEYQLEPAVINLLLEYIFYTNEYKLPRNLVTKVAAHWKRLNIQTIKEAQELAKKEQKQYKEWQSKQEQKDTREKSAGRVPYAQGSGRQAIRKDKLPPWIEAQQQKEKEQNGVKDISGSNELTDTDDTDRKIEELLKDLGEWKEGGGNR